MDLETENRIAAILLKETAELRRQADREGVHVYLQQPKVRGRPNSRFLTATVLGVQQANRAVEVNEMWRVRQKELELNDRLKGRLKDDSGHSRCYKDISSPSGNTNKRHDSNASASCSSSKRVAESSHSVEDGLRDEELEEFLKSRVKRGRGSIGSRMDETGPYLPRDSDSPMKLSSSPIAGEHRVMLGPEKPPSMKSDYSSSDEEEGLHVHKRKKKNDHSENSHKKHTRKHKAKEKSRDKKKKREEKRSKRHK